MPTWKNGLVLLSMGCLLFASPRVANAATIVVKMREIDVPPNIFYVFDPTNATINPGDTVKWTNTVANPHDSTHNPLAGGRLWASPRLSNAPPGNAFSFTFPDAGTYPYWCLTHAFSHPEQTGNVTVVALNLKPEVAIASPTNGAAFFAPASFTIQADASDPDGSVAQVQFFRGAIPLGMTSISPYTNNVSALTVGSYVLTAVATDDQGAKATSSVVNVTVTAPPTISVAAVQQSPEGNLQFQIRGGNAGQTCIIDACETLPNWTPIFTNVFPNTDCAFCPFVPFTESATNLNRRFYRSRVLP